MAKVILPNLIALILLAGCISRPVEDLIFAEVALKAAQKAKAESLAQETYRQAENYYLRAKKDYNESYFDSCKNNAHLARRLAEQAEYKSLLKQSQLKNKTVEEENASSSGGEGSK